MSLKESQTILKGDKMKEVKKSVAKQIKKHLKEDNKYCLKENKEHNKLVKKIEKNGRNSKRK